MKYYNKKYDVIVAGGGLSGVAAGVAAAREGANVLLIENNGFLGGMATAGLVNPFMCYYVRLSNEQYDWHNHVNKGIFNEIIIQLNDMGGLHENKHTFNEEILKLVLDRMINKHNISLLLHSFVSGVERAATHLNSITVNNKSGTTCYQGRYFVDATGDADLCALAGCDFKIGRDDDNLCQPMTLCFRLANVDWSKYNPQIVNEMYQYAQQKGLINNPRENVLVFEHMVDNIMHFNSTRIIKKSAINTEELTEAEMEAREQVFELYNFMKSNVEGFENCQLLMSAPHIGIRESRRIIGEYTITQEEILGTKKFNDSIARGNYSIDIHSPSGSGSVLKVIPFGDYYTIPYKSLIPLGIDNLIIAGRPISSTHEAHSALRVMPICTSIGEGAGTAAAIALKHNISFKSVEPKELHVLLDKHDAVY